MALKNEGGWDRAVRMVAGLALLYAAWLGWPAVAAVVFLVIGAVALLTASVGWCPAYSLFGISTRPRETTT